MILPDLVSHFRILDTWRVREGKCYDYRAQVIINPRQKTAVICPWWDGEKSPPDYLLHEVLHIVLRAYAFSKDTQAEETTVQDLCALLNRDGMSRATLAQRDREVLGLRSALETITHPSAICSMTWYGTAMALRSCAREALASTAQAGAEAERRLLEAAWERLLAAFPPDGVEGEVVQGAKAAILGTESGEGR